MDSANNASADHVRFQLALPPELVEELRAISEVNIEQTEDAPQRVQHELALETVAAVVTILVGVDQLMPTCKRIADQIHKFFSKSGNKQPRVKVTGERDETVIEIDLSDVAKTADTIRIVVKG